MIPTKYGLLCTVLVLGCGYAQADELSVQLHGFLNTTYDRSNSRTVYDGAVDDVGGLHSSSAGLAALVKLPENWSAAMQFHAGTADDTLIMDWAYATYQPQDSFALRVGKIKYPGALVSEYYDVGFAQPWTIPPEEFYSANALGPNLSLEAFIGASPVFAVRSGDKRFVVQPYFGENNHDDGENANLFGVRAGMSSEGVEVLVNYSTAKVLLDPTSPRFVEVNDKNTQQWNVGASFDRNRILAMVEYGRSKIDDASIFDTAAGYVTLGYHFGSYLPSVTYASFDQDGGLGQKSVALTLRHELTTFSAVKAQLKSIDPDQLGTPLVSGDQPSGLFSASPAEGRVRIFSVSLNLVF